MSRSYRKPKIGFATGSNTEYYRERNRSTRTKNRQQLRKLSKYKNQYLGYDNLEDLDIDSNYLEFTKNKRNRNYDSWGEPTDGSHMLKESDELYTRMIRK